MLPKTAAFAVLATLAMAQPLAAEEHYVLIMGEGFFPETSYVQDGDTIRFINSVEDVHSATARDGSWTSGDLASSGFFILDVAQGVKQSFTSSRDDTMSGQFIFGEAPLTD